MSKESNDDMATSEPEQQSQQQHQEWCRVFKPEIDSESSDPLVPGKRYHDGVFVETDLEQGKGTFFHVVGEIYRPSGMKYKEDHDIKPEEIQSFLRKTPMGHVLKADFESGRISEVLRALPVPTRQQGLNWWERDPVTGQHEFIWVQEDGERYADGVMRRPTFKCNEWTSRFAFPALINAGVLHPVN